MALRGRGASVSGEQDPVPRSSTCFGAVLAPIRQPPLLVSWGNGCTSGMLNRSARLSMAVLVRPV